MIDTDYENYSLVHYCNPLANQYYTRDDYYLGVRNPNGQIGGNYMSKIIKKLQSIGYDPSRLDQTGFDSNCTFVLPPYKPSN